MSKIFSNEQVIILRENPYVAYVSPKIIRYTLEFKEFAISQANNGLTSTKIFKMAGFDIDVLGTPRIYAAMKFFKKEAASPQGLRAARGMSKEERDAKFAQEDLSKKKTDAALKELQDEIVHLKQQVEFLKKISFLDS